MMNNPEQYLHDKLIADSMGVTGILALMEENRKQATIIARQQEELAIAAELLEAEKAKRIEVTGSGEIFTVVYRAAASEDAPPPKITYSVDNEAVTPKYKVNDKVLVKSGESGTIVYSEAPRTDGRATYSECAYRVKLDGQSNQWTYLESELEPYTEPEDAQS